MKLSALTMETEIRKKRIFLSEATKVTTRSVRGHLPASIETKLDIPSNSTYKKIIIPCFDILLVKSDNITSVKSFRDI